MLSIYIIIKAASTGKKFIEEKYSLFREDSTLVYFPVTREVETCQNVKKIQIYSKEDKIFNQRWFQHTQKNSSSEKEIESSLSC